MFPYKSFISMKYIVSLFLLSLLLISISCQSGDSKQDTKTNLSQSEAIIDEAIEAMGGNQLNSAYIQFDFRGQKVSYQNHSGTFLYARTFQDTASNQIIDTLTNTEFIRYKNGQRLPLTEEEAAELSGGINSIIYFAFLPYRLLDPAVQSEYINQVNIKGKTYHKIQVTFTQEGGGQDYDDEFLYYFDTEDLSLDYLAYQYHVHGGGLRFRVGYNERVTQGLKFRDYLNLKGDIETMDFNKIETYYEEGLLKELSKIEIKNLVFLENHE